MKPKIRQLQKLATPYFKRGKCPLIRWKAKKNEETFRNSGHGKQSNLSQSQNIQRKQLAVFYHRRFPSFG